MEDSKCLLILRHADSDLNSAPVDFDRPLNQRGTRNAIQVGLWLKQSNLIPEYLMCSAALRARQTALSVTNQLGVDSQDIQFIQSLYLASPDSILKQLGNIPALTNTAMVVGHNPGLEQLLNYMSKTNPKNTVAGARLNPASLVQLAFNSNWDNIDKHSAEIVNVRHPG